MPGSSQPSPRSPPATNFDPFQESFVEKAFRKIDTCAGGTTVVQAHRLFSPESPHEPTIGWLACMAHRFVFYDRIFHSLPFKHLFALDGDPLSPARPSDETTNELTSDLLKTTPFRSFVLCFLFQIHFSGFFVCVCVYVCT